MAQKDAGEQPWAPDEWKNAEGDVSEWEAGEEELDEWEVGGQADWMLRDDEFLLEEDREYVLRDEGSWREYVSPALFGLVLAVMVGDVITTGVGMAMGLEEGNPLVAAVVAEVGLGGLVLVKAMSACVLVLLPGVTKNSRQAFRAGSAAYLFVGLLVVVANVLAIVTVAG